MMSSLDRGAIVEAADRLPPSEVNLRNVGRLLGVSGQALYSYVSSTDELHELVAASWWPTPDELPDADLDWREWWTLALGRLRERLLSVPDLVGALAGHRIVTDAQVRFAERGVATLVRAGVEPPDALLLYRVLVQATVDHVARIHRADPTYLARFWSSVSDAPDTPVLDELQTTYRQITAPEAFAITLDLLLAGIEAEHLTG